MRFYMLFLIFTIYICVIDTGHSVDTIKCIFPNTTKNDESEKLMNVISSIVGQNFETEKESYRYVASICSDVSKDHELGAVIRSKKNEGVVVLGRRNDTQFIQGDSWLVLIFGSGDFITEKKDSVQRRTASIYLVCNPDVNDDRQSHIQLVQDDGRNYIFTLSTHTVCHFNEQLSGMKIFLMILGISFSVYCIIGITYRRYVHNAQHCQQIPHLPFWSRIGNKLADCCNYICRCDSEEENSWNNITSNFESGDRDEALLRP